MSDEIPTAVSSMSRPNTRLVNSAVTCFNLRKSISRVSIALTARRSPAETRLVTGSTMTTWGWKSCISLYMLARCDSSPEAVGRVAWILNRPRLIHFSRLIPTELMLRRIWLGDSSYAKYMARSSREQAELANAAAKLDLPVPAVPVIKTLLPRKNPFPPSMVSRLVMPLERRSVDAVWVNPREVMGTTEIPLLSIRNGYSFVPCDEPRYFITRRRRVEICSLTRWSSISTQSATYSSSP